MDGPPSSTTPPHTLLHTLHTHTLSQVAPHGAYFDPAPPSTPVHFNRVGCHGNESSLLECELNIVRERNSSYHASDAGVICTSESHASHMHYITTVDFGTFIFCGKAVQYEASSNMCQRNYSTIQKLKHVLAL